jgi:SPP1 gp7 family putative phage head morphogenesis protein
MLGMKDAYAEPVEQDLLNLFYRQYFAPLLSIIDAPLIKLNAADNAIMAAIRSGQIQYKNDVFFGKFNVKVSQQLSKFAIFDSRAKVWKGRPPASIIGAAVIAETKRKELTDKLNATLEQAENGINDAIRTLSFGDDLPLLAMRDDIQADLWSVGVKVTIDEKLEKKLRADYTDSQKLNIKNWNPEQVTRLREMVQRIQTTGDNSSIRELIQSEWNTSAAKARFLARQETSLFFSKLSMNRAESAGVRRYRWSTSHDQRVRPDHKELQGTIHAIDDPPIVDSRTGRRAHPGQDYNCFPGYMLASAEGIEKIYRRKYSGKLIRIKTSSGFQLDVTPNHPILTDKGWIAANLIEKGFNILGMPHCDMGNSINMNIQNSPSMLSQIFDLASISFSKHRTTGSKKQFHGDGKKSEVEIISLDGQLGNKIESGTNHHFLKFFFSLSKKTHRFLSKFSKATHFIYRNLSASYRIMSGNSKSFPFFGRCLSHTNIHPFASVPNMNIMFSKNSPNSISIDAQPNRNSFAGFAREIFIDKVEFVDSFDFNGHVYNLQTKNGWYIVSRNGNNANGLIVHNCRCAAIWMLD